MTIRTYTELRELNTLEERFDYLHLRGSVGNETFGHERYLNQQFYRSREWRNIRYDVIARDEGMDLGIPGFELYDKIIIHHMNPITLEDVDSGNPDILDPEFLITVSHNTHNAIHYGDRSQLPQPLVVRKPGDTREW